MSNTTTLLLGLSLREANDFTKNPDGSCTSDFAANMQIIDGTAIALQDQLDALNTNAPQTLQATAPLETLYAVAVYADSRGDGGGANGDNTLKIVLDWVDPSGYAPRNLPLTTTDVDGHVLGSAFNHYQVFLARAGSIIKVTTSFAGNVGNPFHYDIAVRIVKMPKPITG